jgi:hypothetical protein
MNTIENNKLIAEFMKLAKQLHLFESPISGKYIENLKYHSSWNWLMEVVDKINTMNDYQFSLHIYHCRVTIYDNLNRKWILDDFQGVDPLPTVYNACVEFIKWYNEQNK